MTPPIDINPNANVKVKDSCNCSCPSKCCFWPFRPKGIHKHKQPEITRVGEPTVSVVNNMSTEVFKLYSRES